MQKRTIADLHDRYIGHRKFAKVCDLLTEKGYKITDIKEYNEKFTFRVNDTPSTYDKAWKASAASYVELVEKALSYFRRMCL